MATPKWFEESTYLSNKADQLNAIKFNDQTWTADSVKQYFADNKVDAYTHFVSYGNAEEVSPNANFDVNYYLAAKADSLNAAAYQDKTDWTAKDVLDAFKAQGMSAWDHYTKYGQTEGIDPCENFSTEKYFAAKVAALNAAGKTDPEGNAWTVDSVKAYFVEHNVNPVEHYTVSFPPPPLFKDEFFVQTSC